MCTHDSLAREQGKGRLQSGVVRGQSWDTRFISIMETYPPNPIVVKAGWEQCVPLLGDLIGLALAADARVREIEIRQSKRHAVRHVDIGQTEA